ncbi:Hypothetical predicted protein, partial [Pelobates cultripes]
PNEHQISSDKGRKTGFVPNKIVAAPTHLRNRLHYYSTKEAILTEQRKASEMQPTYEEISLYADLSPTKMFRIRDFINVTKCLRNHKVPYRWGFPTKLFIWRNGSLTKVEDPPKGMETLKSWGLSHDDNATTSPAPLRKVTTSWTKA